MLEFNVMMPYKYHTITICDKKFIKAIGEFSSDGTKVSLFSSEKFINMDYVRQFEIRVCQNVEYLTLIIDKDYPTRRFIIGTTKE